ncbi:hypothetical protein PCASD_18379 [Puccinia coronata f. sp. avenae]|nr:hypothetical protein PCASD_18379 [Puccinia coronata f. sp. avenae]
MVDPGSCAEVSKNYIDFQKSTATYVQSQLKRQLFQNATKSQKLNQSPSEGQGNPGALGAPDDTSLRRRLASRAPSEASQGEAWQ